MSCNTNIHVLEFLISVGWWCALDKVGEVVTVFIPRVAERLSDEGVWVLTLPNTPDGVGELVGSTSAMIPTSLKLSKAKRFDDKLWIVVIFGVVSFNANAPFV